MEIKKTLIDVQPMALTPVDSARVIGVSRAQLWKLHGSGRLPKPVYLGTRAPRWLYEELRAWLAAGCPDLLTWERLKGGAR
jgi:predicted DNA-binding transcriptional regulator AlpA